MLSIEHLNVDYIRRGQVIHAVRDFSMTIGPGETVGLVGESGSGKSSVALAILRLIRPQEGRIVSGKILFQGTDLLQLPERDMRGVRGKKISMIFQDPFTALNPVMRIREQMEEGLGANSATGNEQRATSEKQTEPHCPLPVAHCAVALERVQLEPTRVLSSYPHQLSGGQRQRVMMAMALLAQPSLVLADEPTTALDVLVQKEILELLFKLQKELGMAMLFITHNLGLVAQQSQRIAVMKEGEKIEEGPASQIFGNPRHEYTQELMKALPRLPPL